MWIELWCPNVSHILNPIPTSPEVRPGDLDKLLKPERGDFEMKPRSKATWMHPRSHRWHQLDHIIVRKRQLGDVKHCRSMHSTDCNTDHALVRCKLRMQPKKFHQAHPRPSPAVDTTATRDFMRVTKFQELLTDQFSSSPTPNTPGPAWSRLKSTVTDCALTAFGRRTRTQPDWFRDSADILLPALEAKRAARTMLHTRSSSSVLRAAKSNVQRLTRTALCRYWSGLSARIQHCADSGDLRGLYNGIKEAIGPTPKKSAPLLSASGEILTDPSAQLDRWAQHYSYLYANDAEVIPDALTSLPHFSTLHELDSDITLDAVKHAISGLKNNKSPGADGIPPEVLKCGGVALTTELFNVFLLCWHSHCLPQDLKDANIITIYKNKGNRQDCKNYRGISLLCIAGKVFARVLLPRLQVIANRILPESQCGFRSSCSTVDMVFSLRQLQEKCVEQQRPLYVVFIDLTKAFDSVSRSGLFSILKRLGCPDTLLSILMGFHDNMQASVQFNGSKSEKFPVNCGVKQGCVLAPTLFGICFSALLHRAFPDPSGILLHTRSSGKLFNLSRLRARTKVRRVLIRELLYADDAAIVAHSETELQSLCSSFAKACSEFGLKISPGKTVALSQGSLAPPTIYINGKTLSVVEKFPYLGSTISNTNSLDAELDCRIGKAATTFGRLRQRVWSNRDLSIKLKIRVYVACVLSILLYCSESWTTYRRQERRLNSFHFRCLRSILGISWRDHVPNVSILRLTGATDMFTLLRQRRLRWAGHVHRQDDGRIPKDILYGELAEAPRPRGRPRLRYKDVLKRDLAAFGIPNTTWESTASNRSRWRSAIYNGCSTSTQLYIDDCESRRLHRRLRRDGP